MISNRWELSLHNKTCILKLAGNITFNVEKLKSSFSLLVLWDFSTVYFLSYSPSSSCLRGLTSFLFLTRLVLASLCKPTKYSRCYSILSDVWPSTGAWLAHQKLSIKILSLQIRKDRWHVIFPLFHTVFDVLGRANGKGGWWIESSKALTVVNMEVLMTYFTTRKKNWKNRRVFIVCIKTLIDLCQVVAFFFNNYFPLKKKKKQILWVTDGMTTKT